MPSPPPLPDSRRSGRRLLGGALAFVAVFALAAAAWTVSRALQNPDVQARRPDWADAGLALPFWLPLFTTVVVGAALVFYVLWRAHRRLRAGEDLYADRYGRGLRRRGERSLGDEA